MIPMSNKQQNTTNPTTSNHAIDDQFLDDGQADLDIVSLSSVNDDGPSTSTPSSSPSVMGEQSLSGDMPDPESDDNVLENAHAVGLALEEDEEHPKPLNIAADINKAEEYRKTHE